MFHIIQADFYRLFRSKGFWITEILFIITLLLGVLYGVVGSIGVHTDTKAFENWVITEAGLALRLSLKPLIILVIPLFLLLSLLFY